MKANMYKQIYEEVKKIPKGKVSTYGDIAKRIGRPTCSRIVGYAINKNPSPGLIPCHRIVFANGSLSKGFAFGGIEEQKRMLEKESVKFKSEYIVDLEICQYIL